MSRDGLELFFDMNKLKDIPAHPNLTWDRKELNMPIDKPYAYHKPSVIGMLKITKLREHFAEGERLIRETCGENRQAAIAITNNEQTAMWAIKAVVFNDPDSQVE